MSTKNLARTVIEGGRHKYNKWERRNSHAIERAHLRNYLREVEQDLENYEEYDPEPLEPVRKDFDDKLGPIYRWLRRQVGRPWDEVRADVSKAFDIRTTAGRHIVFDHMLNSVATSPEIHHRYSWIPEDPTTSHSDNDYYVDDDGILQKKRYLGRRRYSEKVPPFDTKQLANWLGGRVVGMVGNKLFWFVPVGKPNKHKGMYRDHVWRTKYGYDRDRYYYYNYGPALHWEYLTEETVYKTDSVGNVIYDEYRRATPIGTKKVWKTGSKPFFRQGRKLNTKDLEFWNTLPDYYKTKVLEQSPNYPDPPKPKYPYYY